MISIYQG